MCAEIIAQPGDDVALPSRQRLQPGPRHLVRRLLIVRGELLLIRNRMKLRFRRSRAQRTNANPVRLHFFRQTLRKEKIKRFRRSISGNVGHRLKRSRRSKY